jgi:hypothetical protein
MNPLAEVMMQLGMQQMTPAGGPAHGKPPTISPMEFDKRFAAGNVQQGYPVDDDALMRLLLARQRAIDSSRGYPNDTPLLGEMAAPFPMRP